MDEGVQWTLPEALSIFAMRCHTGMKKPALGGLSGIVSEAVCVLLINLASFKRVLLQVDFIRGQP